MARLIASTIFNRPLDQILLQRGLFAKTEIDAFVARAAKRSVPLHELLIAEGALEEHVVYDALAESWQLPFSDGTGALRAADLPERVAGICQRENLLVLSLDEKEITIATAQPERIKTLQAIFSALGYSVSFALCLPGQLPRSSTVASSGEELVDNDLFSGISDLALSLSESDGGVAHGGERVNDLSSDGDGSGVVELVNKTLLLAIQQRTSDIHIESTHKGARVRFRIDGVLSDRFAIEGGTAASFVSRLLIISGLDITEKVMPQDGSFKVTCEDREIEFRIACIPGIFGQNVVLRMLSGPETQQLNLASLGMLDDELGVVKTSARAPHGMILVAGPTGSGKSTTLYGVLDAISDPKLKFITIEDPVERRMAGVQQIQVRLNANEPERSLTFARGLRTILRLDPDIIMVGEIRDAETAQISIQASLTGHLVLSTVHANSSVETLRRLQNIGVDFHLLMSSLNLVFAQRLMRKLCASCKKERPLKEREAELINDAEVSRIFEPAGCPSCMNTGYRGRAGIFEFLPVSEEMRDLVAKNGLTESIIEIRESRVRTLLQSALIKVGQGVTDFVELERVCGPCL